jgi:hypothetical protein
LAFCAWLKTGAKVVVLIGAKEKVRGPNDYWRAGT